MATPKTQRAWREAASKLLVERGHAATKIGEIQDHPAFDRARMVWLKNGSDRAIWMQMDIALQSR
jgi:hypothetical protein